MQELFGVEINAFMVGVLVLVVFTCAVLAVLVARNPVLVRLAARNANRRAGRSALIVLGLMLGTAIIASALSTGDATGASVRGTVLRALGTTDVMVLPKGIEPGAGFGGRTSTGDVSFDASALAPVAAAARSTGKVDGVAPAIVLPAAALDTTSRQTEPGLTLFATDPSASPAFARLAVAGTDRHVSLSSLGAGEAYVDATAADDLGAKAGDALAVHVNGKVLALKVAAVVDAHGTTSDQGAVLLGLGSAQRALGLDGRITAILVSNKGGEVGGAGASHDVETALTYVLKDRGLASHPVKADGLKAADQVGAAFLSMFTTFGSFSVMAGILLIFLVFVMLATERRTEMGIARAVGMQRRHLVDTFLFEGVLYDVAASVVGALLGAGIAFVMVTGMASMFSSQGVDIRFELRIRSLVIAAGLGALITLAVVTLSAWRVSRMQVVAAIRGLPEKSSRSGRRRRALLQGLAFVAFGVLTALQGAGAHSSAPFMMGLSFVAIGLAPLALFAGVPRRLAYSGAAVVLVVLHLLPYEARQRLFPDLRSDFSSWVVGGIMVVIGATWLVVYNADIVLGAVNALFGRSRRLAPVLRTSIAYPLRNRFRTGVTLAMFTLVVFNLVVAGSTYSTISKAVTDVSTFSGGFDVRVRTAAGLPDPAATVRQAAGAKAADVKSVASQSVLQVDALQTGTGAVAGTKAADYVLRGVDDAYTNDTSLEFATTAKGYPTTASVWAALRTTPGLAVVDALAVEHREAAYSFGTMPDFKLTGFAIEDQAFTPVTVDVTEARTGQTLHLTVIGVLRDSAPLDDTFGLTTSQRALSSLGAVATPTAQYVTLQPGTDARSFATSLESALLPYGAEVDSMAKLANDAAAGSRTFNVLLQGFLGLGLVVGVTAMGVISARSVVERRQQIGVLRAIGFQREMVRRSFLLETAFVAVVAIVVGTALGLVVAFDVIRQLSSSPNWSTISFTVPWLNLVLVFAVVLVASLAAAFLPARNGARVYPAEALRYQ